MTNWPLIGPAPFTSMFDEQADAAASTGFMAFDKTGGAWIEYAASWDHTTNWLRITVDDASGNRSGGFEIGIGGSGVERSIFFMPQTDHSTRNMNGIVLPITIRAGERVAVKFEATSAATGKISLDGYYDPLFRTDFRYSDAMGVVSQTALTVPDPGGVVHTKGGWEQIVASTSNNYKAVLLVFCDDSDTDTTTVQHLFDIGIGESASEVVLIADIWVKRQGRTISPERRHFFIPGHIPAGVRIAVRCQADNIIVGQRDMVGVSIIGFY